MYHRSSMVPQLRFAAPSGPCAVMKLSCRIWSNVWPINITDEATAWAYRLPVKDHSWKKVLSAIVSRLSVTAASVVHFGQGAIVPSSSAVLATVRRALPSSCRWLDGSVRGYLMPFVKGLRKQVLTKDLMWNFSWNDQLRLAIMWLLDAMLVNQDRHGDGHNVFAADDHGIVPLDFEKWFQSQGTGINSCSPEALETCEVAMRGYLRQPLLFRNYHVKGKSVITTACEQNKTLTAVKAIVDDWCPQGLCRTVASRVRDELAKDMYFSNIAVGWTPHLKVLWCAVVPKNSRVRQCQPCDQDGGGDLSLLLGKSFGDGCLRRFGNSSVTEFLSAIVAWRIEIVRDEVYKMLDECLQA